MIAALRFNWGGGGGGGGYWVAAAKIDMKSAEPSRAVGEFTH